MRWARILVLLLAVGSAIGAAVMVRRSIVKQPHPMPQTVSSRSEVLVLRRPVQTGERVTSKDLRWQSWPSDAIPSGVVHRRSGAQASEFQPALARHPLIAGEPVSEDKLIRPGKSSAIAAMIASGKRAISVPVREESAVGGLIQPGDHVDVLWTANRSEGGRSETPRSQLLLRGVKVLAIGGSIHTGAGSGRTATLELSPGQMRRLASARARGDILLALIPVADVAALPTDDEPGEDGDSGPQVKIIRFGK